MKKISNALKGLGTKINGVEPSGNRISEILRSFGSTLTGADIKGKYISDVINDIGKNYGATISVSLVPYTGNDDLLGKKASDLQSNVEIGATGITGTLKYVSDYTGFSGNVEEQSGNYLVLKAVSVNGATITGELVGGTKGPVTLDSDGIIIFKVASNTQSVRFIATKGSNTATVVYNLTNLVLTPNA